MSLILPILVLFTAPLVVLVVVGSVVMTIKGIDDLCAKIRKPI